MSMFQDLQHDTPLKNRLATFQFEIPKHTEDAAEEEFLRTIRPSDRRL